MNALAAKFGFSVDDFGKSLSLVHGDHFKIYPVEHNGRFAEDLRARQIDLIRIATAVHVADSWVFRRSARSRLRSPHLKLEVLDLAYWSKPDVMDLLKRCVDFVSGGDDWTFSFVADKKIRHKPGPNLFPRYHHGAIVSPYSGGLDSSSGLAIRAAAEPDRTIVPVTVRHQTQKAQLLRKQFKLLTEAKVLIPKNFNAFQAGVFIYKEQVEREFGEEFREVTHRCRPFLFMTVAGLVANSFCTPEVEVYESGVGAINLPLVVGPADYRTTRSTHPRFLQLLSALVSHVNDASVKYVLPFVVNTKAEMAETIMAMGLEELAKSSVSCILHPLKRKGARQCGVCPACIFRRHAMFKAGIVEEATAYGTDLFCESDPAKSYTRNQLRAVKLFHEQIASLRSLDCGVVPSFFRQYLMATDAVRTEKEVERFAAVYGRFRREWLPLIVEARRRNFPWINPIQSRSLVEGVAS